MALTVLTPRIAVVHLLVFTLQHCLFVTPYIRQIDMFAASSEMDTCIILQVPHSSVL